MAYFLEKEKTGSTPYVILDEEKGFMKFEGESFHENVLEFYKEINDWLDEYLATEYGTFTFECNMNYFNSSTAKLLLIMLMKMDEHTTDDKKVIVNWVAVEENDMIIECGEDFEEEMENLEFNLVIKESP